MYPNLLHDISNCSYWTILKRLVNYSMFYHMILFIHFTARTTDPLLYCHNITKILLKVALNTITVTPLFIFHWKQYITVNVHKICLHINIVDWFTSTSAISAFHHFSGLTPPHFCACPKPGPGFPTSYVMVFFMFNYLKRCNCSFCWCW